MAKAAGMRYITITSKHHDGFAMWDSKVSDYNIVKRTPYGKDVLKMLADECKKEGIKLFFYHSQLDWHHPDYFPRGNTGGSWTGRPESGDMNKYLDYMDAQLTELLTNYGDIAGIWFDGMWDKKDADWRLQKTYDLIHQVTAWQHWLEAIIIVHLTREKIFKCLKKIYRVITRRDSHQESKVGTLPKETCETINNSWGFNLKDDRHKSKKELIQYLVKAAGYDANFLLNVGPMPNGKIQPEHIASLKEMGEWLKIYGETIYGTRGGPLTARDWGVTTQNGNKVYVHILKWFDESITIPSWGKKIKSVKLFQDKTPLKFTLNDYGLSLKIPKGKIDEVDTVIEVETN